MLLKLFARTEETGHDGPYRQVSDAGNFAIRRLFKFTHYQDLAVLRLQSLYSIAQYLQFGSFNQLVLSVGFASAHVARFFVERNDRSTRRRFRAKPGSVSVTHDREQPSLRIALPIAVTESKGAEI
jgi:hypothetical protein